MLFEFVYLCGLRAGELIALQERHLDYASRALTVPACKTAARTLQFNGLWPRIELLWPVVLVRKRRIRTSQALYMALRRLCLRAQTSRIYRPHDLRRTCAANICERTGNIVLAKEMLGHTSVQTTEMYIGGYNRAATETATDSLV